MHNLLQPHTDPARFIHILINLYQFPNIYSQQIQQPQRHTHTPPTHNHTPQTSLTQPPIPPRIHPNTSHSHPSHTHTHTPTPTHTPHTYTTPKTPICAPSPHKHKTLHNNIYKVSNLLKYTYCIAVPLQLLSTNT